MDVEREKDIEQLRKIARVQESTIAQLLKVIEGQSARLDALEGRQGELQRALDLANHLAKRAEAEASEKKPSKTSKTRKARESFGPTEQPTLPRVEAVFELDEADRVCNACGGALVPWKDEFETSEMIDVVRAEFRLVEVKRQKYRCGCGGCVDTALGPERTVAGGRYSLDFGIDVAVHKYLDHLPLARQVRILQRSGIVLTSQTLWDQLATLAKELEPTYDALLAHALREPVIGLDQTSWPRLEKGAKDKKPWQMWCVTTPASCVHAIRSNKGEDTFRALLAGYSGTVVCDDLGTHTAGARGTPIVLAGCWAHVLRRFRDAAPNHPEAELVLGWIGELYAIDDEAEGDLERLAELRRTRSREVAARIFTYLGTLEVLQSTSIGEAARYTFGNRKMLERFLDDARIPLDNNRTERALRGPVVGRRNHFGSKSERGTEVAAIFYSLLETAKLVGVNPAEYLREAVLAARGGRVLLPSEFAGA